jgi:hypothetical protein
MSDEQNKPNTDPQEQFEIGSSSSHPIPTDEERDEVHRYLREKYANEEQDE